MDYSSVVEVTYDIFIKSPGRYIILQGSFYILKVGFHRPNPGYTTTSVEVASFSVTDLLLILNEAVDLLLLCK